MKIAYLSNSVIPSRTANSIHVMKMCQSLAKQGNDVLLVCSSDPADMSLYGANPHTHYNVDNCFDIIYLDKKYPESGYLSFFRKKYSKFKYKSNSAVYLKGEIQNILKKFQPRVVIGRDVHQVFFSAKCRYRSIFEQHHPLNRKDFYLFNKMIKWDSFLFFIAITNAVKHKFIEYGNPENQIIVLPDGADLPSDNIAVVLPGRRDVLRIGYTGHLYPGKGIEVIQGICDLMPEVDFHIVGGFEQDISHWKSRINSHNVFFHGYIPQQSLSKYINAFDICLLPNQKKVFTSCHKQGNNIDIGEYTSPLKMFDYMAHRKPIVASDLPVLREILNETNAMLVDPEDHGKWVEAIRTLTDPALRDAIASQAYQDFINNYTWTVRAKKLLDKIQGA